MFKRLAVFTAFVAVLALAPVAQAAPISGGISLSSVSVDSGLSPLIPIGPSGSRLGTFIGATALDFTDTGAETHGFAGSVRVDGTTGDFGILHGLLGTIQDFTFAGAGQAGFPAPRIDDFEHVQKVVGSPIFSFDLLSTEIRTQTENLLTLTGTGLFHLTGFEDTEGSFFFSANNENQSFSFSVSEGTPVPEPVSLLLLGSGLLGLGAIRRRITK